MALHPNFDTRDDCPCGCIKRVQRVRHFAELTEKPLHFLRVTKNDAPSIYLSLKCGCIIGCIMHPVILPLSVADFEAVISLFWEGFPIAPQPPAVAPVAA